MSIYLSIRIVMLIKPRTFTLASNQVNNQKQTISVPSNQAILPIRHSFGSYHRKLINQPFKKLADWMPTNVTVKKVEEKYEQALNLYLPLLPKETLLDLLCKHTSIIEHSKDEIKSKVKDLKQAIGNKRYDPNNTEQHDAAQDKDIAMRHKVLNTSIQDFYENKTFLNKIKDTGLSQNDYKEIQKFYTAIHDSLKTEELNPNTHISIQLEGKHDYRFFVYSVNPLPFDENNVAIARVFTLGNQEESPGVILYSNNLI